VTAETARSALRFDVRAFLEPRAIPLDDVPERYRVAMFQYLSEGKLPEPRLQRLLENDAGAVRLFADDLHGLLVLSRWLDRCVPAFCHGNRDQVGLWCAFIRRQRGLDRLGKECAP
jgi:hypothetical protein